MERVVIAAALVAVALVVAFVIERRRQVDVPTQGRRWELPTQLDRADFRRPEAPWLVVVFTSATCASCALATIKATVVASDHVAVEDVPWQTRKDLHDRYRIEVVPATLVADAEGVVRAHFVGAPTATDLWAAVAEARAPGSSPEPELGT